jgi:hypothetical protein
MKEIELFNTLKATIYPDLVKASSQYSVFDCVSLSDNSYIELKCRGAHYAELLIEKSKYDRLMRIGASTGKTVLYINSTPSGIYSWDLSALNIEWSERAGLPVSTQFDNREKITKTVGYLSVSDSKVLAHPSLDIYYN